MALNIPIADPDPQETREWLEALDGVLAHEGSPRAAQLLERLVEHAQHCGTQVDLSLQTPYVNTIPLSAQSNLPGNATMETRLRHYIRWNAMAMVVRANQVSSELGGHVASFASAATLYDVGTTIFPRAVPRFRRRPRVLPGAFLAGRSRYAFP